MTILLFKEVHKHFGKGFSLYIENTTIEEGEILALLGPNGAGKTTTLKLAVNLLKPDKGKIVFMDKDLDKNFDEVKEYIGYVPDAVTLYDFLKVEEFISFLIESYNINKTEAVKRINYLNSKLFIKDFENYIIKDISLGMKQRLGIFSALLKNPKILVVDEPLVGLDPFFTSKVKELFREYVNNQKGAILMSTHLLNVAEELSTRICMISNGRILYTGTISELKEKYKTDTTLETLFLQILHYNNSPDSSSRSSP